MEPELEQLRRDLETLTAQRKIASQALAQAVDIAETIRGRKEVQRLDREIDETRARLLQIADRILEIDSSAAAQLHLDRRRSEREEAAFWFRRFFTTLGIANGAAFAALASGLLQADDPASIAHLVGRAMDKFLWGALGAGSIPFLFWLRLSLQASEPRLKANYRFIPALIEGGISVAVTWSVVGFCWGLFLATGAVNGLAEGKKIADDRVAAASQARVHAPPSAKTASKPVP